MPDSKKTSIVQPLLVMTLVCIIMTLLLATTNVLTRDRIDELAIQSDEAAKRAAFPAAASFEDVMVPDGHAITIVEAIDATDVQLGYAITTAYRGYGGLVYVMTGIRSDGKIQRVLIMEDEETPGLGKKIEEDAFLDPFLEMDATSVFTVKPDEVNLDRIDAIAGATISSYAVANAVNEACETYLILQGGGT